MTINTPLAAKVMDHIAAHPDEHMQGDWITRGHDLESSIRIKLREEFYVEHRHYPTGVAAEELEKQVPARVPACGTAACFAGHAVLIAGHQVDTQCDAVVIEDGPKVQYRAIRDVAVDLLGLTMEQAVRLFAAHNTIDNLWEILAEYSGGEIVKPEAG